MESSGLHPIEELLEWQKRKFHSLMYEKRQFWDASEISLDSVSELRKTINQLSEISPPEGLRIVLWDKVLVYQKLAFFYFASEELDVGYSMLRNASELARDVDCIGDSKDLAALWIGKKLDDDSKELRQRYQEKFKFNMADKPHQVVKAIYSISSGYGIHGHFSSFAFSEVVGRSGSGRDEKIFTRVSEPRLKEAFLIWFMSFFPLHVMCSRQFRETHQDIFNIPWKKFAKDARVSQKIFNQLLEEIDETSFVTIFQNYSASKDSDSSS